MSLAERIKYAEMKARHQKQLRPWYKKWWGIIILILSGIILMYLVAAGFYVFNKIQEIRTEQVQIDIANQKLAVQKALNGTAPFSFGATKPQMTIIEFGDFACPFCANSYLGLRNQAELNKEKVRLIWRDYPLHDNSVELAQAARCAGEQNKFWEMHDELLANQDILTDTGETLQEKLITLAQGLQVNSEQFTTCLNEKRYIENIKNDFQDGETLQISGTPTWFINNYRVVGSLTEEKFQELFGGLK